MSDLNSEKKPFYDLATIIDPPYVMATSDGRGHEGLVVDVLKNLAKSANFGYKLTVINGTYGHQERDSTWSGLIGSVVTLPADMAVGAIAKTQSRESVMDFTEWFHSSSVQLLMLRPTPEEGPGAGLLLAPFSAAAWVLIVLAFLLVSAGFFLIGRFSPREWIRVPPENDVRRARYSFGLRNSFLFAASTLTWQGYREAPKSLSGRVLAVSWWMFVSMIIIAYTSNLTALVTSRPHVQPALSFRNYEDILRDRSLNIGMIQNGDADLELESSDVNLEKQLHEYVSKNHNWVSNLTYGLKRMRDSRGTFALLLPSYKARYLASHHCDLITFGHGLGMIKYAFGFPAGNSLDVLRRRLDSAILALRETDEMDKLSHEWDRKGGECADPEGSALPVRRETVSLTFMVMGPRDLAVPFLLLFLCGLLAGGIAALEILNERGYLTPLQKGRDVEAGGAAAEPLTTKAGTSTTTPVVIADIEEEEEEDEKNKDKEKKEEEEEEKSVDELEPEDKEKSLDDKGGMDDVMLESDDVKSAEDGGEQGEKTAA